MRVITLLLAACACAAGKGKGRGGSRFGGGSGATFDSHHKVMQLLTPQARACDASNGTLIGVANAGYASPAYCPTKLPKKRQCVCLSFGTNRSFGSSMAALGCKTLSFDPFGGSPRTLGPNHAFVPADLSAKDGLAVEANVTIPVLSLSSIIDSNDLTR